MSHISSYIIHLFFIFSFLHLNFSSPYSPKKKKKNLLLPISSHLHLHFFQHFPFLFVSSSSHYSLFTVTLPSSFFCFDFSSPHFIFYKFDIIFSIQFIFFLQKTVSSLSLSGFLLFLITLIMVDFFFFFNMCFSIVCVCVFYFILFFIFRKSFLPLL